MTAPDDKRQGLARAGLTRVMRTLALRGEQKLHLVVTPSNQPAVALYTSLGFVVLA
jgi:ribosomal protein S18 acetylase RimI-like enzyme